MNNGEFKRFAAAALCTVLLTASGCFIQKIPPKDIADTSDVAAAATKDTPDKASSAASSKVESASDVSSKVKNTPSSSLAASSSKTNSSKSTTGSSSKAASSTAAKAESILLSEYSVSMNVGDEKYINATVMPTNEEIVWKSSSDSIAIVDDSGRIAAMKPGTCTITASARSNKDVSASLSVTVSSDKDEKTSSRSSESSLHSNQPVTGLTLSLPVNVLAVGQTVTPIIELTPESSDSSEVTLTTSDSSVVYINNDGSITAYSTGACTLNAVYSDNDDISDSIIVTVTDSITPEENIPDEDNSSRAEFEDENEENGEDDDEENDGGVYEDGYYVDGILIVNKSFGIPRSYNPGGLTKECEEAFYRLRQGAAADNVNIYLSSGFRSYDYQSSLYSGYVSYYGTAVADTFSARPGHSEHQTGLAIDCNIVNDSFIGTPEAIWLAEHCHEYGFIIRYPQGKQGVTGYKYEPWHIRYVGDMAEQIYESGLTLEEYYDLPSQYDE